MKVLQLIDTLETGGAERMAVNIANALAKKEISSYLCSTRRSGPLENDVNPQVEFLLLDKKGTLDLKAFRKFLDWIRRENIDVIHAHSTSIYLAVVARVFYRRVKIVWHDHYGLSENIQSRPKKALKLLVRYIDVAIVVNETLAQWSQEILKIRKVIFIRNFAQLNTQVRKITKLKGEEGKRVICLANLRPQKNHEELINGFKETLDTHQDWTLHLVGKSFEDTYEQDILELIKINHLENNIFLYGSCSDVAYILDQSTIGVLVSTSEGLPVSLLEYGNAGLPVIVSNVGQCADVVGEQGIVIENIATELPEVLRSLYNKTPKELKGMGSRFREKVINTYSREAFLEKLLPVYKALLS